MKLKKKHATPGLGTFLDAFNNDLAKNISYRHGIHFQLASLSGLVFQYSFLRHVFLHLIFRTYSVHSRMVHLRDIFIGVPYLASGWPEGHIYDLSPDILVMLCYTGLDIPFFV